VSATFATPSEAPPAFGVTAPPRAHPGTRFILPAAAVLVALALAWPQRGQAPPTLGAVEDANGAWMAMILLLSSATYLMGSIALLAAAPSPIPFRRTFTAQVAAAFTNRLAPAGLGGMATNVRFLELAGASRPGAIAAVGMNSLAGLVVHVVAMAAVLPLLRGRGARPGSGVSASPAAGRGFWLSGRWPRSRRPAWAGGRWRGAACEPMPRRRSRR
jgi:hypothetical protein